MLLVYAPLPLGSRRPWALGLLAIATWALAGGAALNAAWQEGELARKLRGARWPLVLLGGYCALVAAQLMGQHTWNGGAAPDAAVAAAITTLDASSTRPYLLTAVAHAGAFVGTLLLVHGERRLLGLAFAVLVSGLLQSVVGVGLLAYGEEYTYLAEDFTPDRAQGTFTNPDHLANYLALCLAVGLGLLVARFEAQAPARNSGEHWARLLRFMLSTKMLLRLMLIVMVIALVLTRSRMGNLAFFTSLLVVGGTLAWRSPQLRRPAMWLVASLLVVDVLVVGKWVGLDRVVQRLQETAVTEERKRSSDREETFEQRQAAARDALTLVRGRPLWGYGGGTFYAAFPAVKGPEAYPATYDHTHNDYVEIAVDTGLVGLALLAGVFVLAACRVLRLMRDGEPRHHRGLATGLAMALCAMGMHALVDFPLQIPANAWTFTVLLACAWTMQPRERRSQRSRREGVALAAPPQAAPAAL